MLRSCSLLNPFYNDIQLCDLYINAAKQKDNLLIQKLEKDYHLINDAPLILIANGDIETFIWLKKQGYMKWYINHVIPYGIYHNQLEIVKWGLKHNYPLHNYIICIDTTLLYRKTIWKYLHNNTGYRNYACKIQCCPFCKINMLNNIWLNFEIEYTDYLQWFPLEILENINDFVEITRIILY